MSSSIVNEGGRGAKSDPIVIEGRERNEQNRNRESCGMELHECGEHSSEDEGRKDEDNENCAPSVGLEESWYVAPSACIARR